MAVDKVFVLPHYSDSVCRRTQLHMKNQLVTGENTERRRRKELKFWRCSEATCKERVVERFTLLKRVGLTVCQ